MPSCSTPTITRLLARHLIRFLGVSTIVAFVFVNIAPTERGESTPSKIWSSVFSICQQHALEPKVSYKPKDDAQHIKQVHHDLNDNIQLQLHASKLSLEELRTYIAGRNGFYVRDWSVGLGRNNVRYIIEASLMQAKLLNRVLVIPSFLYARDCEFNRNVCSQYAHYVENFKGVGLSVGSVTRSAWQLPIQVMFDLPLLRSYHPVILASEFLELYGLDPSKEILTGLWNKDIHKNVNLTSFHVIPNPMYDEGIFRVDTTRPLPEINMGTIDTKLDGLFRGSFGETVGGKIYPLYWDDAIRILNKDGYHVGNDEEAERVINRAGWIVTYTYKALGGMEFSKSIAEATRQIVPRSLVRGWVEDFTMDVDVLLLEGEVHIYRKPASLRFTTKQARDDYTCLVTRYIQPIRPLVALSEKLASRMTTLVGGRAWLSAHLRRGDFVALGWGKNLSLEAHFGYIKDVFSEGKEMLEEQVLRGGKPRDGDPFFIATDERNPDSLDYLRQNGAVLLNDLLTIDDRREIGWPLLFTDIVGMVEQRVTASSALFYGSVLSSFAGGVLNVRVAMGLEPNSWIVDQ